MMIANLLMIAACAANVPTEKDLVRALSEIFAKSAKHYKALDAAATPLMKDEKGDLRIPHGWLGWKGKAELDMRSIRWWTSGHFPGSLWYLYEATGDRFFRERAIAWTEILEPNKTVDSNHDVGFIMYCSFGNARRILKTNRYDGILVETAASLASRFNDSLGLLRSWGAKDDVKAFLVIPDNMMNLELLEAASKISGDSRFDRIARSHATVTMKNHFRGDGSCYHVLNYDQGTRQVKEVRRGQGLSCATAWSRGQSWAIYGFSMMYRETKDPAYLAVAQKAADCAMNHPNMPTDGIPCWDYGAPGEERDASAGAIMASGLLELSGFVGGEKGAAYRAFAVKQLLSLASPAYFSEGGEVGHFLLKHGVGHKPAGSEIDTPLDYADYYFLEALLRVRKDCGGTCPPLAGQTADPVQPDSQDAGRVEEIAAWLPEHPKADGARIGERSRWERLAATDEARALVAEAEEIAKRAPYEITDDDYTYFKRTGLRSKRFKNHYAGRRFDLGKLTIAECLTNTGRFLPAIERQIEAILSEKSWVFPPHDKKLDVFEGRRVYVDINSCERALALAIAIDWLKERLPVELVGRVRAEVRRRILEPYLATARDPAANHDVHWWFRAPLNWNSICHSCVTRTALALVEDRRERAEFCECAERGVKVALAGFGDDGFCFEGMGYWSYGWGHQLQLEVAIRQQTGGRLKLLNGDKPRRVTDFGFGYQMNPGVTPNYADGGSKPVSPVCIALGKQLYADLPFSFPKTRFFGGELAEASLVAFQDRRGGCDAALPPHTWFESAQAYIGRAAAQAEKPPFSFSIKGGNNGECRHQHHDIGSFNVAVGQVLLAGDPGSMDYTAKSFGAERFKMPFHGSYGHPVPVVAGKWQANGKNHAAKVVSTSFSPERDVLVYDLKGAYDVPELVSLTRTVVFDRRERSCSIRDHVGFSRPATFETAVGTKHEIVQDGAAAVFRLTDKGGSKVRLSMRVLSGGSAAIRRETIKNPRRLPMERIALAFNQPVTDAETEMRFDLPENFDILLNQRCTK